MTNTLNTERYFMLPEQIFLAKFHFSDHRLYSDFLAWQSAHKKLLA